MTKPELTLIHNSDPAGQEAAAWFARLRADDTSQADRERHARWIESNPEHRAAYQRVERLWSSLGHFAHEPELERLMRPSPRAATPKPRIASRKPWRWAAIAATLAIAAWGAFNVLQPPPEMPVTVIDYATSTGERRSIELEDGTQMDLDASTRAQVRYSADARTVILSSGRAFFHVAKDPARPFEVASQQGRARALGTQFETAIHADSLDITLYEGRVALLTAGNATDAPTQLGTLSPGEKARLSNARMALLPQRVESGGAPGWLTGNLVFNDTPLAEAVAEFNRYSTRPILLKGDTIRHQRVSGVFRGSDAEGFVEALRDVYGFHEQRDADGAHVLSSAQ